MNQQIEELIKYQEYLDTEKSLWCIYAHMNDEYLVETKLVEVRYVSTTEPLIENTTLYLRFKDVPDNVVTRVYDNELDAAREYLDTARLRSVCTGAITKMLVSLLSDKYPELLI